MLQIHFAIQRFVRDSPATQSGSSFLGTHSGARDQQQQQKNDARNHKIRVPTQVSGLTQSRGPDSRRYRRPFGLPLETPAATEEVVTRVTTARPRPRRNPPTPLQHPRRGSLHPEAYIHWIRQYILFSDRRHPAALGPPEVRSLISRPATERDVAASTRNQALSASLSLYRGALEAPVEGVRRERGGEKAEAAAGRSHEGGGPRRAVAAPGRV